MQPHLTEERFKDRFVELVLGARAMPRKRDDQHLLLISSILQLEGGRKYSEAELNQALQPWSAQFGASFGLDHVTLRRALVDEGYLQRDRGGVNTTSSSSVICPTLSMRPSAPWTWRS